MQPILHSKKDAARILGVSERTLHSLIATEQLAVRRIGRRVLVSSEALDEFVRLERETARGLPRDAIRLAKRIENS